MAVVVAGLTEASRTGTDGTRHAVGGLLALSAGPCTQADSESEGDGSLAEPQNIPNIVDFASSNPRAVILHKVNRKLVNPAHTKNRKWDVFRTVNHSKIV